MYQVGQRRERRARKDPTSSLWRTTRIKLLHKAPSTHSAQGRREADGTSSFVNSSDEEESHSSFRQTQTCWCARTGKDGRNHTSGSQTSKWFGNKIRDSQDPGYVCGIRPRILRLKRLVSRQQCGGFGSGQTSHRVNGPPGLERRGSIGKRPVFLSNFLAAGGESTGSELPSPQRMEKGVPESFETTAPGGRPAAVWPWKCAGSVVRWRLWSCSKLISDQETCCHSNPRVSCNRRRVESEAG